MRISIPAAVAACNLVLVSGALLLVAGCAATASFHNVSPASTQGARLTGSVFGGQQPVSGGLIQLYAVGLTGDGSTATPLISATLTTSDGARVMNSNANAGNANNTLPAGSFTITGDYTCPTVSSEVYLVSTGGNPGLGSGTNANLTLMTALGQCGTLSSSTYVVMNELTTVSSLAALSNFATSYTAIGSGTSDSSQLSSQFTEVSEYTNTTNGSIPGPTLPAGYSASSTAIQTLGDIVSACINSAGGTAGDNSACGNLFSLATISGNPAPTDTVGAIINILNQPTVNASQIFALLPASGPFQPALSTAPANWELPITSNTATQLVFTVQPSSSAAGSAISPAVAVTIEGAGGNPQTFATNMVTLAIGANPNSGTLGGAVSVNAVNGVATFSGISINNAGTGYTLTASSPGLTGTTSGTFNIVNPPAGYAVSGTVTYSGSKTGWIYLKLSPNSGCNNCSQGQGTAIPAATTGALASGEAFTINGVPAGTYTLTAFMDNLGYGAENASNPTGSVSSVIVTSLGLSGQSVALTDPATVTLGTLTPGVDSNNGLGAFNGGALAGFDPICNGSGCNNGGIEMPASYEVQYSTSSSFTGTPGSKCFPATGASGTSPYIITGLTNGQTYYFRAAGNVGACGSSTTGLTYSAAEPTGGLLIGAPTAGSLVSGTVSFTTPAGGITGPLYVSCYAPATARVYVDPIASPVSPQAYSVYVPNGTSCDLMGFIDQKNSGLVGGPGEISNTNNGIGMVAVTVNGTTSGENITLPSGNSIAEIKTEVNTGGGGTSYGIGFQVYGEYKLPVAVELLSETPEVSGTVADVALPADIATGVFNGNSDEFDYWPNVTGSPVVGDSYKFNVTYSDGTSEQLTAAVTGVLSAFATDLSPTGTGVSTTPNFSWDYPSSAGSYVYSFQLTNSNGNTIWEIPPQDSSTGFASTISPFITWGVDPTNSGDLPNSSYLTNGGLNTSSNYNWSITAHDANMNEAQASASFTTTAASLALPSSGPGPALAGYPFTGSIGASGGSGSGYSFTVNGTSITATSIGSAISFYGNDGLLAYSSGGTLYIVGTPTTAESSLPLSVTVTDSGSNTVSQNFTLVVSSGPGTTGVNDSLLNGTYVCKLDGYFDADGSRWAALLSFQANGSAGTLTNGVWDQNSRHLTTAMSGTVTGSYSIGADNNGLMAISSTVTSGGSGTYPSQFAIALNNTNPLTTATEFRMVETDDVGASPTNQHGTGVCYQATTSAFASSTISGNSFAYGLQGEDASGLPEAWVGRFTAGAESSNGGTGGAAGGSISNGIYDGMYIKKTSDGGNVFTGSYTAPNSTSGRFTISMTQTVSGVQFTGSDVGYIDADRMFLLETVGDGGMQDGDMRKQQQTSYSGANLDSSFVVYAQGYEYSGGSVSGFDSSVYQGTGNGASSSFTFNSYYQDADGRYKAGGSVDGTTLAVTFDIGNPGRATASFGDSLYLYFFNYNSAFELDLNGGGNPSYLETGWLEPQSQTTFTDAAVAGNYMAGKLPVMEPASNGIAGQYGLLSNGNYTGGLTTAGEGDYSYDHSISGTYNWDTTVTGTGSFLMGSGSSGMSCIVISSTRASCIVNADTSPSVMILQQ